MSEEAVHRAERRNFGENLTRLMGERGLASIQVAEALGVSRRTVDDGGAEAMIRDGRQLRDLARLLDTSSAPSRRSLNLKRQRRRPTPETSVRLAIFRSGPPGGGLRQPEPRSFA